MSSSVISPRPVEAAPLKFPRIPKSADDKNSSRGKENVKSVSRVRNEMLVKMEKKNLKIRRLQI